MFRWLSGRIRCLGGKHERSEKHVRRADTEGGYISRCSYCRTPMKRRTKRHWVTISQRELQELQR